MPLCPECGAGADQIAVNWLRTNGFPANVVETLVRGNGHQVLITYRATEKETHKLDENDQEASA
jgi:hypothetical protein